MLISLTSWQWVFTAVGMGLTCGAIAQDFTSPPLEAVTSWVGNTYGGGDKWVQQDIHALAVTPDGTVFTNVPWDEGGGNCSEYRDGSLVRTARHLHGWGANGGEAVAANARYVYIGMEMGNEGGKLSDAATWPPQGSKWWGVSRRTRADLGLAAPFPGGKGGKGDTLKSAFLVVAEVPDKTAGALPGLCASETRLYVADPAAGRIAVFDAETMQPVGQWKVEHPGPLVIDGAGLVWMLERRTDATPARLRRFRGESGEPLPPLTFPDAEVVPMAFCLAGDARVLVADDGPAQQIRIFSVAGEKLQQVGTFGDAGGMASGTPGASEDRKFNHVTALGCDAAARLYVAQDGQSGGGGTVLESYRLADGELNWRLFGLTFVDMGDIDATEDTDVFTKEEHLRLDYRQPAGREAEYAGFTIDREKYPQDARLHIWSGGAWVRRIEGRRVLFVNDMNGDQLQVYRFAPATEVAIPSGLFAKKRFKPKDEAWPPHQPQEGAWIWRDTNGNGAFDADEFLSNGGADAPAAQGWSVDASGNVWLATEKDGVQFFPVHGLDAHGNPRWDYASMQTFPPPAGFTALKRLRYDAVTDTLWLGGTTEIDKNQHWKPMGPVLACYDGWLHGTRTERWRKTLPYARGSAGHESCEPMGFDVAGDFIFVPYTGASRSEGVKTGRVEVFRAADGGAIGHLEPGPEVGEIGLQDLRETLTAHRRPDGEYIVLMEDDFKSKMVMYRVKNLDAPRRSK